MKNKKNIVIVGRPNVGKSSLFNRLLGHKRSIVLDVAGVTRDRIVEPATWWVHAKEYSFNLIDTGGLGEGHFKDEIALQVRTALEEAAVVLFVMDIRAGITNEDRDVFTQLRKAGVTESIPMIGVLNKADSDKLDEELTQFYELGLDPLFPISAEHSLGIEDLKDCIVSFLTDEEPKNLSDEELEEAVEETRRAPRIPNIAIVGQPNVGKSTMLNAICGEARTIVSPIAGTTVDAIDTKINWQGKDFIFVDTAGIRRKNKTEQGIEVLSVVQTKKTLERADLALLVMDAELGVYDQDEKIAGLIEEAGCSVILVLNKWDLQVKNDDFSQKLAEEQLRKQIRFLGYAPLVFTTAKDGIGLERVYRLVEHVLSQRALKLTTKELTEFVKAESEVHNPGNAKFYLSHQSGRHPPTFVSHVSDPRKIHFSLTRHLINAIRKRWGYMGTPIRFHFMKAKNSNEKK